VGGVGSGVTSAPDVVVVGGGPAGSATAFALARAGVAVTLLDRARFPRDKPCAEYLSPEASRVLAAMGVLADVEAVAAQLDGMRVRSAAGHSLEGRFASARGFRGFRARGLAVPRRVLDALLLDAARAAGVRVCEAARVTDLLRAANGRVTGVATARGPLAARVVVGADGLNSVVATRLGLARRARWPRRVAFVAHYDGVADIGAVGEMHVTARGYAGFADVGAGRTNVAVVVRATHAAAWRDAGPDPIVAWAARVPHLRRRMASARAVTPVRAVGPFASRARRAWAPGAALVGDAADFFDPFTGEGIHAALHGAVHLAPRVLAALDAPHAAAADAALAGYDAWRRTAFAAKWRLERVIALAVAWPPLLDRAARALARRSDLADTLVAVTGDVVPAAELVRPRFLLDFLRAAVRPA
jgi:flavin-dependent dehydrogenase